MKNFMLFYAKCNISQFNINLCHYLRFCFPLYANFSPDIRGTCEFFRGYSVVYVLMDYLWGYSCVLLHTLIIFARKSRKVDFLLSPRGFPRVDSLNAWSTIFLIKYREILWNCFMFLQNDFSSSIYKISSRFIGFLNFNSQICKHRGKRHVFHFWEWTKHFSIILHS